MTWSSLAVLPAASVAVKVRVMTRGLAVLPEPVCVSVMVTTGTPQLSEGGPGTGLPLPSKVPAPVACDALAAGTSLRQV
jgi:hypothetical protein